MAKGWRMSRSSREKLSESLVGRKLSEEHIENLVKSHPHLSGKNANNWRGGKNKKECENCGKIFLCYGERKFCSRYCASEKRYEDPEEIKKLSSSQRKRWDSRDGVIARKRMSINNSGENHWNYGKKATRKSREKHSITIKKRWQDFEYRNACLHRFRNTLPERVVKRYYDENNIKYIYQYYIKGSGINGGGITVDFYLPKTNTVVFVDGCFWHACSLCKRNRNETRIRNIRGKDKIITENLIEIGYKVKRIWEHEIREEHSKLWKEEENTVIVEEDNVNKILRRAA